MPYCTMNCMGEKKKESVRERDTVWCKSTIFVVRVFDKFNEIETKYIFTITWLYCKIHRTYSTEITHLETNSHAVRNSAKRKMVQILVKKKVKNFPLTNLDIIHEKCSETGFS